MSEKGSKKSNSREDEEKEGEEEVEEKEIDAIFIGGVPMEVEEGKSG